MSLLIEKQFDPTPDEQELLDYARSNAFPYYFQTTTENYKGFAHVLMIRNKQGLPQEGTINSDNFIFFEAIFRRFCSENNIKISTILRASINCTPHSQDKHGDIHIDHQGFEHYNFLLYMNDVDGGLTYFFNDNNDTIIGQVTPKKNKVIVFNGCRHAQGFCANGQYRFLLVFTFTVDNKL